MRENNQHELFIETKENTLANSLLMCFIGRPASQSSSPVSTATTTVAVVFFFGLIKRVESSHWIVVSRANGETHNKKRY